MGVRSIAHESCFTNATRLRCNQAIRNLWHLSGKPCQSNAYDSLCARNPFSQLAISAGPIPRRASALISRGTNSAGRGRMLIAWVRDCTDHPAHCAINTATNGRQRSSVVIRLPASASRFRWFLQSSHLSWGGAAASCTSAARLVDRKVVVGKMAARSKAAQIKKSAILSRLSQARRR